MSEALRRKQTSAIAMPPSKERASAKAGGSAKKGGKKPATTKQLSAEQLYEQAQVALQFDDYDSARDALRQAHKQEPEHLEVLSMKSRALQS